MPPRLVRDDSHRDAESRPSIDESLDGLADFAVCGRVELWEGFALSFARR